MYTNITDQVLPVNNDDAFDTIALDQDDTSSHYTIVPNALIRDFTISPSCRWLIIYLISNKPGWTIKSRQLWEHTKGFIGRDAIRKILNEAIKAGYMRRDVILKKAKNGAFRGYAYVVSSTPKFKKVLPCPDFQGPTPQGPVSTGTKELLSQEVLSLRKEEPPTKVPKEPTESDDSEGGAKASLKIGKEEFSIQVREIAAKMLEMLMKHNPTYRAPDKMDLFLKHVRDIVDKDKQDIPLLMRIFEWAITDREERGTFKGWQGVIVKNKKAGKATTPIALFRQHLTTLHSQMLSHPKRKFAPSSDMDAAMACMAEMNASAI